MKINRLIYVVAFVFLTALVMVAVLFPKEQKYNNKAEIRIGAGDDLSGVLMEEIVDDLKEKYEVTTSLESSSFMDCCSNTAQWALNAKEINVAFFCTHIAKHTVEKNKDVEIYGPVIMNSETIVYKRDWDNVDVLGVTQGRERSKELAREMYPQIKEFQEISVKGLLYAMEDEQVGGAILDITKAARVADYPNMPLAKNDYVSYVLVVDKEFEQTQAFQDFIESLNTSVGRLNDKNYLAGILNVDPGWLDGKNIEFLGF